MRSKLGMPLPSQATASPSMMQERARSRARVVNNQREAMREVVARAAIEPHAVAILVNDPEPSYAACPAPREKIGNSEGARYGLCKHRKRAYASHGSIRLGFPTMLRSVIALSAVVVALSTAQAAEPETLTLTCQGTVTGMAG